MTTPRLTPFRRLLACTIAILFAAAAHPAAAQTAGAFTYQGKLTGPGGTAVTTPTNLRFQLFSAATGGTSLAGPVTRTNVPVTDGLFTTDIDFGNIFQSGNGGWVEIAVLDSQSNATILTPRQKIVPAPLASGVVGLPIALGPLVTDVDNTASSRNFAINGAGGSNTAYLSFVAGTSGQLTGLTLRVNAWLYSPTIFATVYTGVGTTGTALGSATQVWQGTDISEHAERTLDLSNLNINITAGQTYSISVLCGATFSDTAAPAPGTSGIRSNGIAADWWFRTRVQTVGVDYAVRAGSATNATNAANAVAATTAVTATTAQALNANAVSGLNDREFRLRASTDDAHGIAWFGTGTPFRNTGFAPDGPVVFGYSGGGLGTSVNSSGVIALQWNGAGNVGIGTAPANGSSGYRLQLPNTASPQGQGRANAWVTYSSREYKHDIQTLADPLTTLSRLRGVQFVWNDALPDGTHKHDIGFIAEEVADAIPDLVTRTPQGAATGLDYGKVVPITVEAIKAQQAAIVAQRAEIAALKAANTDLKARLDRIESMLKAGR